jgi:16S rRNA (cytosine967-C5)-methyltransferase
LTGPPKYRPALPVRAGLFAQAATALGNLLRFEQPADQVMRAFFRANPQLGRRERATLAEWCFAVLRRLRSLTELAAASDPRSLLVASLAQRCNLREVEALLRGAERELFAAVKARIQTPKSFAAELDLPDWMITCLRAQRGDAFVDSFAAACLQAAPLDLRVNTEKISRATALAEFANGGIAAQPTQFSPVGIRLADKIALEKHPLYIAGAIEVQDEGSQLAAWLVQARRGEVIVDYCAGAGGKTLALGAAMCSTGRIYACDPSPRRLLRLRERARRAGLSNVQTILLEGSPPDLQRLAGKVDRVLVDAPCTGTGTLRRNPDLKWRHSAAMLTELCAKQAEILAAAARLPRHGGRLVYATCSVLAEENEAVIEAFLATQPGYRCIAAKHCAGQLGGLDAGEFLRLWPQTHGCDGFFAAVLQREK